MNKVIKTAAAFLTLFVMLPIWFFLLYTVLKAIHPDRLVWFLFWLYLPATTLAEIFWRVLQMQEKE